MLKTIIAVGIFIYHCVCEYLIFLLVDLFFKGPLDRAVSARELGVLWALEGSILLLFSLTVTIVSHRPLLLAVLTLLTFLYSLLKWDDSLKELGILTIRYLRWADSRFFSARCFVRRQWRRWRLPLRASGNEESFSLPYGRQQRLQSPRMGPAQLFSPSSLARTDPPARKRHPVATLRARGVVGSPYTQFDLQHAPKKGEKDRNLWKEYVVRAWSLASPIFVQFFHWTRFVLAACGRVLSLLRDIRKAPADVAHSPRGLQRLPAQPLACLNPLLMALAHSPLLHAALNRMRAHADCTVGQEAAFVALLPVVNALATAGAEAEAGRLRGPPVSAQDLRQALHRIDDRQRSLADLMEWFLSQLHVSCREANRSEPSTMKICQQEAVTTKLELSQLPPVSSLISALRPPSPHVVTLHRASAAALVSDELSFGLSELRQLLNLQTIDLSLCAACGRPAAAFASHILLRVPNPGLNDPDSAPSLTALIQRAFTAAPRLCNAVLCACGATQSARPSDLFAGSSHGLLSPIGGAPTTPQRLCGPLLATPTAQTSTPVGGWRCRGDGCCRRLLRRLPACLMVALPLGVRLSPCPTLELGPELLLAPEEEGGGCGRYALRAIVGAAVAFCRLGNSQRWFECEHEEVYPLDGSGESLQMAWRRRGLDGQEKVLLFERSA